MITLFFKSLINRAFPFCHSQTLYITCTHLLSNARSIHPDCSRIPLSPLVVFCSSLPLPVHAGKRRAPRASPHTRSRPWIRLLPSTFSWAFLTFGSVQTPCFYLGPDRLSTMSGSMSIRHGTSEIQPHKHYYKNDIFFCGFSDFKHCLRLIIPSFFHLCWIRLDRSRRCDKVHKFIFSPPAYTARKAHHQIHATFFNTLCQ